MLQLVHSMEYKRVLTRELDRLWQFDESNVIVGGPRIVILVLGKIQWALQHISCFRSS